VSEQTINPEAVQEKIQANTIIIQFAVGSIGSRKRVASSEVEVDADKSMLRVSKEIMNSDGLRAINRHAMEVRDHIRMMSLPSLLRSGLYQLPISLVEEVDAYLTKAKLTWQALIREFLIDYAAEGPTGMKGRAKEKLRALYDEEEYPEVEEIERRFTWDVRYMTFQTPKRLQSISQALYEREREKAAALAVKQQEEITFLLRSQMLDLVAHLQERLSPDPSTGKRRVFRDTLTDGIREFFDYFSARNVFNDGELAEIVDQAKAVLGSHDADVLRDNEALRDRVAEQFGEIKGKLDGLLIDAPVRAISFESGE
jgi:hypothetical protein